MEPFDHESAKEALSWLRIAAFGFLMSFVVQVASIYWLTFGHRVGLGLFSFLISNVMFWISRWMQKVSCAIDTENHFYYRKDDDGQNQL
jgi:apolipoprotein N-acyltransferase